MRLIRRAAGLVLALALAVPAWSGGMSRQDVERRIQAGAAGLPSVMPLVRQVDWTQLQMGRHPDMAHELIEIVGKVCRNDRKGLLVVAALLRSPDLVERRGMIEILRQTEIKDDQIVPFLDQALKDPDVNMRLQAAQLLHFQDNPKGDGLSQGILAAETDPRVKALAAGSLARHGKPQGMAALRKLLGDTGWEGRHAAALALKDVPTAESRAELEAAIRTESSPTVLSALIASLRAQTEETDREVRLRLLGRPW